MVEGKWRDVASFGGARSRDRRQRRLGRVPSFALLTQMGPFSSSLQGRMQLPPAVEGRWRDGRAVVEGLVEDL